MDCLDRILVRQHINQTTIGMKTWRRKVTLHLYRLLWLTQHLSKKEWVKKKVKEADEILTKKNVKIPCRSCTNRQKRHFYSWRQTDSNLAGKLGDLAFILFRLKRVLVDFLIFYFILLIWRPFSLQNSSRMKKKCMNVTIIGMLLYMRHLAE